MWRTVSEETDDKKQGVLLIMNMADKASDLLIDEADTSVSKLLEKLDGIYESDNDLMDQFDQFYKFRRGKEQTMKEYIHFYESKVAKLRTGGLEMPDLVHSYLIVEGAQLSDNDKRIAKATCNTKTLKDAKSALLRLTDTNTNSGSMLETSKIQVKEEQEINFYGGHLEEEEVLYNRDKRNQRPRPPFNQTQRNVSFSRECYGCGDTNHVIRDCPHVRELRQRMQSRNRGSNNNRSSRGGYNTTYVCSPEDTQFIDQFEQCNIGNDTLNDDQDIRPIFFQSHVGSEIETVLLVDETINKAVLDCGASRTVCGTEWYTIYLDSLPEKVRKAITERSSDTMFKFGVGMMRASKRVTIPVTICDRDIRLEVDVVDTDIPLLVSLQTMKKLGMNIDFETDMAKIGDKVFTLETTSTGHYAMSLSREKDPSYINLVTFEILSSVAEPGSVGAKKKALKLHKRFAHAGSGRLIKLLKNAEMLDRELEKELVALDSSCDFCLKHKRAAPRPTVALPLAYEFNELVTMDLKQINGQWILHCCDYVTRFSAAHVLESKDADEVMEKLFEIWIAPYGPMEKILADNGGEFVNDKWQAMFSAFNILYKDTASEAPFQNGICERHNDLIGHMTMKVIEDVRCTLQVGLMWAIHAKNSLISVLGFSPYQLVFGKNPNIPGNSTNKLPAMTSYTPSQTVANHLNSLRMAREAYIKAENANRVQRALRGRVYAGTHQRFLSGDVVYYKKKNMKQWQGPGKVLGQDGAQVLVKTGARTLMKLHPCKLILKETAEQQINSPDQTPAEADNKETMETTATPDDTDSDSDDDEPTPREVIPPLEPESTADNNGDSTTPVTDKSPTTEIEEVDTETMNEVVVSSSENEPTITIEEPADENVASRLRSATSNDMKKGDSIYVKNKEEWVTCRLVEKDGVTGQKWKVANDLSEQFIIDFDLVEWLRAKEVISKVDAGTMFADAVEVERIWFNTKKPSSNEEELAMKKELEQWKKIEVYEEVDKKDFPNQKVITCRWVINQKEKPEGLCTKARLVIKGFQETVPQVADSPTAGKCVTRIFIMLANMFKYNLIGLDVRAAFLQSDPLTRLILVKPPKAQRTDDNMVWRLKKPIYGLKDAARAWFFTVKKELLKYGCVQMPLDNSVYVYHKSNQKFAGFLVIHVDDFLVAGNEEFYEKVILPLKQKFQIGTEEEGDFTYVGWNIKQSSDNNTVSVDQIDYQESINTVVVSPGRKNQPDYELSEVEKTEYQQLLGKLQWITSQSRPDIRFKVLESSTRAATPKVSDLLNLNTIVKKLKKNTVTIHFPSLSNDISQLKIYAYADAALNNLPDKVSSARGHTIFLVSGETAGILSWTARKIKKVAKTIIYAEALALSDCLDEATLIRETILFAMFSTKSTIDYEDTIPIIGLTDNKSLQENIYSEKQAEDVKVRREVMAFRKSLADKEIKKIVWIPDTQQLADCLTKNPKSKNPVENLLAVIQTGTLNIHPFLP